MPLHGSPFSTFSHSVLFELCFRWSPSIDDIDVVELQNQHYIGKTGPRLRSAGEEKNVGTVKEMPRIACESKSTQKKDAILNEI